MRAEPVPRYKTVIRLTDLTGKELLRCTFRPDWDRAVAGVWLERLRRCGIARQDPGEVPTLRPAWDKESGPPGVSGFRLELPADGQPVGCDYSLDYWMSLAHALSSTLVEKELLKAGDRFVYRVELHACDEADGPAEPPAPSAIKVVDVVTEVPVRAGCLAEFQAGSIEVGPADEELFPVFVHPDVLADGQALRDAAGEVETGGALLGHLHRDAEAEAVFLEISALIPFPAAHVAAAGASLDIASEAWYPARAAAAVRGEGELLVSWFHTHPNRSWGVDEDDEEAGATTGAFFSARDAHVHRTVFPGGHQVALVLSDRRGDDGAWSSTFSMYGWVRGVIRTRGFHVLQALPALAGRVEGETDGPNAT